MSPAFPIANLTDKDVFIILWRATHTVVCPAMEIYLEEKWLAWFGVLGAIWRMNVCCMLFGAVAEVETDRVLSGSKRF